MNDGGPAFPFPSGPEPRVNEFHERCDGMSLRDYFAIHASDATIQTFMIKNGWSFSLISNAEARYRFADAMLLARTNKNT